MTFHACGCVIDIASRWIETTIAQEIDQTQISKVGISEFSLLNVITYQRRE